MPVANVLLILWHDGWTERGTWTGVADPTRRVEAALGLGAANTVNEAHLIADQQLAILANPRSEVTLAAESRDLFDDDWPYDGYRTYDRITAQTGPLWTDTTEEKVLEIGVSEDENGEPKIALSLRDVVLEKDDAFAQWLKKMANGTVGGAAKPATPLSLVTTPGTDCCPPTPPPGGGVA